MVLIMYYQILRINNKRNENLYIKQQNVAKTKTRLDTDWLAISYRSQILR